MLLRNVTKIVYFTMEFFSLICTVFFMICAVINTEAEGMPTEPKLDIQIEKNKVSFKWTAPPWQISVIQFNIRKYTQNSPTNKFTNVRSRNFTDNVRSFETSLLPCFLYGVIIRITNTSGDVYDIQKKFLLGGNTFYTALNTDLNITWATSLSEFYQVTSPSKTLYTVFWSDNFQYNVEDNGQKYKVYRQGKNTESIYLSVLNVTESDGGMYTSSSIRDVRTDGCCILYVTDKPGRPNLTMNQFPFIGERLDLSCESSIRRWPMETSAFISYRFFIDGLPLDTISFILRDSHRGNLVECQAIDDRDVHSEMSNNMILDPFYGPDNPALSPDVRYIKVTEGETVNPILCTADCYPGCIFKWVMNEWNIDGPSLYFSNVSRKDNGTYTCHVSHQNSTTHYRTLDAVLDVKYSPIITDIKKADGNYHGRQKYILTQEQHLEVDLKVESNPQPEFLFYRRKNKYFKELSFKRDPITTTYTVQFPQMSCYDSGNYTLEVNNGINNSAKIHLYLEIQCSPKVTKLQRKKIATDINVEEGVFVHVLSLPKPNVTWVNESNYPWTIHTYSGGYKHTLYSKITITKYPVYMIHQIEICNALGCLFEDVITTEIGEPESVKNLSVYDITKESALIQWIAGFDGGSMQRFYVQLQKNEDAPNTMNVMTSDTTEGVVIMYRINSLLPKTVYQGVVVAKNKYGKKPTKFKFKTGTDESDLSEREVIIYSFTICFIVAVVVVFVLIIKWQPELLSRLIQKNVKTVIYDDVPADDEIKDLDPKKQSVVYENQIAEEQGNNSSKKTLKSVDRKCVIPEKSHSKGELPLSDQCVSPCSRPIENKVQVSVEKHSFPSDDMYSVVHKSDTNDAKRGSPVSKPNGDKDEVLGDDINDDNSKEAYLLLNKGINVPKSYSYDRLQENKKDNNVAIDELTEDCVQEAYETMTLGQG